MNVAVAIQLTRANTREQNLVIPELLTLIATNLNRLWGQILFASVALIATNRDPFNGMFTRRSQESYPIQGCMPK